METTPGEREHGYDDQVEQDAYEEAEQAERAGDEDAGPASSPDEPRSPSDE